jgi:hypothetical protein
MTVITEEEWLRKVDEYNKKLETLQRPKLFCKHSYVPTTDIPDEVEAEVQYKYGVSQERVYQRNEFARKLYPVRCMRCGGYYFE